MRLQLLFLAGALAAAGTALADPARGAVSDFASGPEGWTVRGPAMGPVWQSHEGNPPGCITAAAMDAGGAWYWHAPARFYGNRAEYYGSALSYDLKVEGFTRPGSDDVILRGGGMTLLFDDRTPAGPGWLTRVVPLSDGVGWRRRVPSGRGGMSVPATRSDLRAVLGALTDLEIRGGTADGSASAALDNVALNGPAWVSAANPMAAGLLLLPVGAVMLLAARRRRR